MPIHVRVWLATPPRGAWFGIQPQLYIHIYNQPKSGSWHSTHGRVWLIGTRAQPDSLARLVRVWVPLDPNILFNTLFSKTLSLYSSFNLNDQLSQYAPTNNMKRSILTSTVRNIKHWCLIDRNNRLKLIKHKRNRTSSIYLSSTRWEYFDSSCT
jgi:hypothetical protein